MHAGHRESCEDLETALTIANVGLPLDERCCVSWAIHVVMGTTNV